MYASTRAVGRKKQWTERITLPLAAGTTDKIDSLLVTGEVRLDFIRSAIDTEVRRRGRGASPAGRVPIQKSKKT